MVGWRNPARYLAPLAIAAVAAAAYLIVHSTLVHNHSSAPIPVVQTTSTASSSTARKLEPKKKFYVVQPNDTLSKIASKTGVSLTTIEKLNPSINPDSLHVSQRLRLR